jgi:carbon monoxide dehydrogenase subunit G
MPAFRHTLQLESTPETVWRILGDLGSINRWIPGITHVQLEGHTRICTFENGAVQHEQIIGYSNASRSFRYEIEGSPFPVKNNRGHFAVEVLGSGSQVAWEASFEMLDPEQENSISQMWDGAMRGALESLGQLIREG